MASHIGRRKFLATLSGAAGWPLAARAQQPERVRRIGVLMNLAVGDPEGEARIAAFLQALQQLGWSDGRNVRIDYRWAAGDTGRFHRYAEELLALAPDVILAEPGCGQSGRPGPNCGVPPRPAGIGLERCRRGRPDVLWRRSSQVFRQSSVV